MAKERVLDKEKAKVLLEDAISSFQKFVVFSQNTYYKQDADQANAVGTGFQYFQRLVEKIGV